MTWTNYHTHSHYCDGEGFLEAYVIKAIENKMTALGFSGHAPLASGEKWHMQQSHLTKYLDEVSTLKKQYGNDIPIYSGLEIDFIPGIIGPSLFHKHRLDITIGSIHYVGQYESGDHCCFELSQLEFELGLKQIFDNDIKKMVSTYYDNLTLMIKVDPPDIIGHLDVIKKLNKDNRYFDETSQWYQKILRNTVKTISKSNCIVEVNTRGHYKGFTEELYPSKWILKEMLKENIPVTISADAHHPDELNRGVEMAAGLLLDIGYTQVQVYDGIKWHPADLKIDGLDF